MAEIVVAPVTYEIVETTTETQVIAGQTAYNVDVAPIVHTITIGADVPDATTSVKGIVELATDGENTVGVVVQGNDLRLSNARAPSGVAAGVLSGTYPNPGFAADMATQAEQDAALALKANLASPVFTGNPTAPTPATSDSDTSVATTAMVQAAVDADVATHAAAADPHTVYQLESQKGAASGYASLDSGTLVPVAQLPAATTTAKGAVELATDGEVAASVAVQGNDARMSNARTPTAHKTSHETGGTDVLTALTDANVAAANKDGAVGVLSLRTLGTGATQALAGTTRLDQITAPTTSVSLNSQKIINLATPTLAGDAATKAYADSIAAGLDPHQSVRIASTANIPSLSGSLSVDSVTVVNGDRVLVKDQTTTSQNGIYVVGTPWTRSTDADTGAELTGGSFTFVEAGTTNADKGFVATHNGTPVLGTDPVTFSLFTGTGGTPSGPASGVLAGSYPNPSFAVDMATQAELDTHKTSVDHDGRYYTEAEVDAALALKAPLASPALTGTPTAPTPATSDNDTSIATTAMVQAAVDADVTTHAADTTSVHGIADTAVLATATSVAAAVSAHEADTTSVHGIADTTDLIDQTLVNAKGDLIAATAADVVARLAVGTNGQVLKANSATGTGLEWAAEAGGGGSGYPTLTVATKTGAYTIVDADDVIIADATTAGFTVTLPTAVGRTGFRFTVKRVNTNANNVIVGTTSSQTIDQATTFTLSQAWDVLTVVSNGSNWFVIGTETAAGGGPGSPIMLLLGRS